MRISINYAEFADLEYRIKNDKHISKEMLEKKIEGKEVITIRVDGNLVGWLRYNYFWDNTPFMNLLYFDESYRRKGLGSKVVYYWENAMKEKGYKRVMTSTLANEQAQFFIENKVIRMLDVYYLKMKPLKYYLLKIYKYYAWVIFKATTSLWLLLRGPWSFA